MRLDNYYKTMLFESICLMLRLFTQLPPRQWLLLTLQLTYECEQLSKYHLKLEHNILIRWLRH